jgi:L-fuconolactonase
MSFMPTTPNFPIIDAHVHLWDPDYLRIPWLDGDDVLCKRYDVTVYREHTQGIPIERFVYVEVDCAPHYTLLEAEWVNTLAEREPLIGGIVAHAPLEYGERVRTYLDALVRSGPHVKGVRRLVQDEADPAFSLQPAFVRGVQLLAEYGLSCDLCIRHQQLPSIIALVRQCPDTAFILDHLGKPDIKGHVLDPWRKQIEELAAFPNVLCKVSGVVTEADPLHWQLEDIAPYVEHVLRAFGEDRVVFGGDWPVVLSAASYRRWVEVLVTLTSHLSEDAQRKLWAENARRFYRL